MESRVDVHTCGAHHVVLFLPIPHVCFVSIRREHSEVAGSLVVCRRLEGEFDVSRRHHYLDLGRSVVLRWSLGFPFYSGSTTSRASLGAASVTRPQWACRHINVLVSSQTARCPGTEAYERLFRSWLVLVHTTSLCELQGLSRGAGGVKGFVARGRGSRRDCAHHHVI